MNKQAYRKKVEHTTELVNELVEVILSENIDIYYQKLFTYLASFIDFEHASVFYVRKENHKVKKIVSTNKINYPFDNKYLKKVIEMQGWDDKGKKLLVYNNSHIINYLYSMKKRNVDYKIASYLSLFLCLDDENNGILTLTHSDNEAFTDKEVGLLELMSPLVESTISKNQCIKNFCKNSRDIIKLQKKIVDTREKLAISEVKNVISATTASLNHEINNPLMIISGNIQLLQEYLKYDDNSMEKLNIIDSQICRIMEIITKLRKIEEPKFENYITECDVHKIIVIDKDK